MTAASPVPDDDGGETVDEEQGTRTKRAHQANMMAPFFDRLRTPKCQALKDIQPIGYPRLDYRQAESPVRVHPD
jgi:hypothetical protein